jgi:hypothetical protein
MNGTARDEIIETVTGIEERELAIDAGWIRINTRLLEKLELCQSSVSYFFE